MVGWPGKLTYKMPWEKEIKQNNKAQTEIIAMEVDR